MNQRKTFLEHWQPDFYGSSIGNGYQHVWQPIDRLTPRHAKNVDEFRHQYAEDTRSPYALSAGSAGLGNTYVPPSITRPVQGGGSTTTSVSVPDGNTQDEEEKRKNSAFQSSGSGLSI